MGWYERLIFCLSGSSLTLAVLALLDHYHPFH